MSRISPELLNELVAHASVADTSVDWPATSWNALARHDVLQWSIPKRFGGFELSQLERLSGNELLAANCLTSTFILSQREAAVRLLLRGPEPLQERYLAARRQADVLTVGFSQLTTSRQHSGPALRATPGVNGSYQLNGVIPWVTAADQAAAILAGATLNDGTQILFALSPQQHGVSVEPPMPLAALHGSRTAQVHCENVTVSRDEIILGPAPQVLGPVGGGGLETSCLTLGLTLGVIQLLTTEAARRLEVAETVTVLEGELAAIRKRLHEAARLPGDAQLTLAIRTDSTLLALRASQSLLLHSKGAGFVSPHPAQRLARQALFFLVWSCPRPVADGVRNALLHPESIDQFR